MRLTNNIFVMGGAPNRIEVRRLMELFGGCAVWSTDNLAFGFSDNAVVGKPLVSMGDDTSGIPTTAAVFNNFAAGDFHLRAGSAGVGKGLNVFAQPAHGAVTTDLAGNPRQLQGAWDRGAYVFP